jgi:hypothetical protein
MQMAVADNIATAISAFWPKRLPAAEPGREMRRKKRCKNPTQQPHADDRNASHDEGRKTKNPAICGAFQETAAGCDDPVKHLIPPRGVEQHLDFHSKR